MKSNMKYNWTKKLKIPIFVQSIILIFSFIIYFFNNIGIIKFYTFLIIMTMLDLIFFEVLLWFIYLFNKNVKIKNKIYELLRIISVAFFLIFFVYDTVNYYKDIPYAVSGQYSSVTGLCTRCYVRTGKTSNLDITIGNMEFTVESDYKNSINEGQIYKVEYLPNSKEVIEIYRGDGY